VQADHLQGLPVGGQEGARGDVATWLLRVHRLRQEELAQAGPGCGHRPGEHAEAGAIPVRRHLQLQATLGTHGRDKT